MSAVIRLRHGLAGLAVLAAVATGTTACQSGNGANAASDAPASGSSSSAAPASSAAAASTSSTAVATSSTVSSVSGGGDGDIAKLCAVVAAHAHQLTSPGAPPSGPDMKQILADTEEALALAPAELKPDLEAMLKFYQDLEAGDSAAATADQPAMESAAQDYAKYLAEHCAH